MKMITQKVIQLNKHLGVANNNGNKLLCLWFTNFTEKAFRTTFWESINWPFRQADVWSFFGFLPPKKHVLRPTIVQKLDTAA